MKIIQVPISDVHLWDKNPRNIKTADFKRLKKQILELGVYKPLLAIKENGGYTVLGGNMRLRVLQEMGIQEIDISVVEADSEAKKIKYALSDNDRAGEYDELQLAELVYPHIDDIDLSEYKVDLGEAITAEDLLGRYCGDFSDDFSMENNPGPSSKMMTFILSRRQGEAVGRAIKKAKETEDLSFEENENSNGNALFVICEKYVG